MNLRVGVTSLIFLVPAVFGLASPPDRPGPDKEKNAVKALFDGIPADLSAKVRDNPVRCDRVNDWLQDNVNGKGRSIAVRVELKEVLPYRRDNGYLVHLCLVESKLNVLDADWHVVLSDRKLSLAATRSLPSVGGYATFSFEGVGTADAEKLADLKHVTIMGKVKEAKLSRLNREMPTDGAAGGKSPPTLSIILEDVLVDGNKWTPSKDTLARGNPAGGAPDNPFGGFGKTTKGGKGKGGDGPGTKKEPQP